VSSANVLATDSFTDFDLQVAISMGQECASVARAVRLEIERIWDRPGGADWVLNQFGCADLSPSPIDFLFVLGDIATAHASAIRSSTHSAPALTR
jgi:hypothetical protein